MALYGPAPGLKGRKSERQVLTTWHCKVCVSSSPLREERKRERRKMQDILLTKQCLLTSRGDIELTQHERIYGYMIQNYSKIFAN